MAIDFTAEATTMGSTPKQDYKLKIDLGDDAPPKADPETEGKPYDAAAKEIEAEQAAKKNGGAYHNSAKMILSAENAVVPRLSAMMLNTTHKQFQLENDSMDMLVEMLVPVLEFHQFKPKDPTLPFIIAYVAIRWVPIWDVRQQQRKQKIKTTAEKQENHARGRTDVDDDTPISPAEEVDDNGNVLSTQKYYYKDGELAKGDIRICKYTNCDHALRKTQSKFCSHSCKAYQQNLDRLEKEEEAA